MTRRTSVERKALARDLAVGEGLLWVCRDLWLKGPLLRLELESLLTRGGGSREHVDWLREQKLVRAVSVGRWALYVVGSRGREALDLDRSYVQPVEMLKAAYARRVVAKVLLEGFAPDRKEVERPNGRLREVQARGQAWRYVRGGLKAAWVYAGVPYLNGQTAKRLVH